MPNRPDYPDWRDTEPPKEDKPKKPKPQPPDPSLVGTGAARGAAEALKKNREDKARMLKELE